MVCCPAKWLGLRISEAVAALLHSARRGDLRSEIGDHAPACRGFAAPRTAAISRGTTGLREEMWKVRNAWAAKRRGGNKLLWASSAWLAL